MAAHQILPKFRVLIIGTTGAGKTSILQRLCGSTEKPEIHSVDSSGARKLVQDAKLGDKYDIEYEITFKTHEGYVFHDPSGFEYGGTKEIENVKKFVTKKLKERRLEDRLHAIWYCVPMDSSRPKLESRYFNEICPDKSIPVIAVFTKYDQFKLDTEMKLEDKPENRTVDEEMEVIFRTKYLGSFGETPPQWYIRLKKMHRPGQRATELIEITANALSSGVLALMLMAVQKGNLELSVNQAIQW